MFGLLRNHRLIYRKRWEVDGDVTAFAFEDRRGRLRARAGQHLVVAVTPTMRKPFSIASAPEEELIVLGTSLRSGSAFKKRLASLKQGEEITARGPVYTYFKPFGVEADEAGPVVMLAQGVGVTPFRSILGHLAHAEQHTHTRLIHVAGQGHAFREDTSRWASETVFVEHAAEFRAATAAAVKDQPDALLYVAGAPSFTAATIELLRGLGVQRSRIRDDPYLFYKNGSAVVADRSTQKP